MYIHTHIHIGGVGFDINCGVYWLRTQSNCVCMYACVRACVPVSNV